MISIQIDNSFVAEGIDWLNDEIKYYTELPNKMVRTVSDTIKQGIKGNVMQGQSIYGGNLEPNKKGTQVLVNTGKLYEAISDRKISDGYEVYIKNNDNRNTIAGYLQFGTKNMIARPFFGISEALDNDIDAVLGNLFQKNN